MARPASSVTLSAPLALEQGMPSVLAVLLESTLLRERPFVFLLAMVTPLTSIWMDQPASHVIRGVGHVQELATLSA